MNCRTRWAQWDLIDWVWPAKEARGWKHGVVEWNFMASMKTGRKGRFATRRKQHIVIVSVWDEGLKPDPEASVLEPSSRNSCLSLPEGPSGRQFYSSITFQVTLTTCEKNLCLKIIEVVITSMMWKSRKVLKLDGLDLVYLL